MGFSPCSTFSFGRPPPLALSGAYFNTFANASMYTSDGCLSVVHHDTF